MIELGKYNLLEVMRDTGSGLFLEDTEGNDVLLPGKFIPPDTEVGDFLEVYIYRDNEDRIIATTQEPRILIYEFAYLEVTSVGDHGAFLSYGVDKDLFVPFREQKLKMEEGRSYLVYMYIDGQTDRLAGSAKVEQFLETEDLPLRVGDEVLVTIWKKTDLGTNVIINNKYSGLIYENELFERLYTGDVKTAYVHHIREDGKVDVRLQKDGYSKVEPNAQKILNHFEKKDGYILLTDKSSPERIKRELGMSKKTFKKAIGALYKQKMILLEEEGIRLV
jgi:predicted RNA-binding protein (virulence factor B family)